MNDPASIATNDAVKPVPRDADWIDRHRSLAKIARSGIVDVLLLGDSITDAWRDVGKAAWDRHFPNFRTANLGMDGDRTQHLLWRLGDSGIDGIAPRVIVLMIGSNNTGLERDDATRRNSPAEAAQGIAAVVSQLREQAPHAKIMLLALLPRGRQAEDPQRKEVGEINAHLVKLHDGDFVHYLDVGHHFLEADRTLSAEMMPDFLHPSAMGYETWARAIKETLCGLLP